MRSSTITIKGQVTIPASLRERFRILPGATVTFRAHKDGILIESPVDLSALRARAQDHMKTHGIKSPTSHDIKQVKLEYYKRKFGAKDV